MELETVVSTPQRSIFGGDDAHVEIDFSDESSLDDYPSERSRRLDLSRAARYVFTVFVGTGGIGTSANMSSGYWHDSLTPTGSVVSVAPIENHIAPDVFTLVSVSDQVATIKSAFGLSVKQLADLLHVQRPTIYAWLDPETPPTTLRSTNKDRLEKLFGLATEWNRLCMFPPSEHLPTLMKSLEQSDFDYHETKSKLVEVSNRVLTSRSNKPLGDRLRAAGFAPVPGKA